MFLFKQVELLHQPAHWVLHSTIQLMLVVFFSHYRAPKVFRPLPIPSNLLLKLKFGRCSLRAGYGPMVLLSKLTFLLVCIDLLSKPKLCRLFSVINTVECLDLWTSNNSVIQAESCWQNQRQFYTAVLKMLVFRISTLFLPLM